MQIPSTNLAASVSNIGAGSRVDKTATTTESPTASAPHVESSNESNSDRDAQGQGDGLGHRPGNHAGQDKNGHSESIDAASRPAPTLPDEPPSLLDLMG